MKKIYTLVLVLICSVAIQAQVHESPFEPKEGPRINLKKHVFSMGNATVGKTITKSYEFINDGTEPLLINDYTTSCRCIVLGLPKEVAPGKTATMTLEFLPTRTGSFRETLYIKTNAKERPLVLNFGAMAVD